jgi:hypothetical protein
LSSNQQKTIYHAKISALPIIQTNEMYGYSTIVVPLTDENITKVNDLKVILKASKTISKYIKCNIL